MFMSYDTEENREEQYSRRRFLTLGALAASALLMPHPGWAAKRNSSSRKRSLSFFETHRRELLTIDYWDDGKYLPEALDEINHALRDWRTHEVKAIDPRLIDLLYGLKVNLSTTQPFHIISGYRSPKTNAMLRKRNKAVAKKSYHLLGQAIDVRVPGCSLSKLRTTAKKMKGGGVGYYRRSNFVHIDVGPVRYW
jgi:uncharacterized protein YcbK (DUF882 family)